MEPPVVYRQVRNDAKDIESVADGYKTKIEHELWLADGLQKDALQNSWDARLDKKHGKGWECGFSLKTSEGKTFFCIEDTGTTGLNGSKFSSEMELSKILNNNERGEDLAYFLNSNWSAKGATEGGNRGRGKTLFLAGSKDRRIFFDSLRSSDGEYLFGEVYLDTDKQVKFILHYGENAKKAFSELIGGKVLPLQQSGTRIFIENPENVLVKAIDNGEILSFISNSRWEIIKKYEAKIFIEHGGDKIYAQLPKWYENNLENIQGREYPAEIIKEGTEYKTKRLVLRYAPDSDLPESIKGIAVQRDGMTIERLLVSDLVREEGMNDIYGWLEMECSPLEEEMKLNCEGPEHFDFSWVTNPARYLKEYLRVKARDFAKELKIVSSEQAKKNKLQRVAEEDAIKSLSPLFKKLGLSNRHKGKRTKTKTKRSKNEPLRLSVSDIEFPREIRRVNYGEEIKNIYVTPINDLFENILVLIRAFIVPVDGGAPVLVEEKELNLTLGEGQKVGFELIKIDDKYKMTGYSFRAKMICMQDTDQFLPDGRKIEKGTVLYDRVNQKFYVEMDPIDSGSDPFKFSPRPRDDKNYLMEWESDEEDGYIIFYNSQHPRIARLIDGSQQSESLTSFLIEQGALMTFQIKLEELMADDPGEEVDKDFSQLLKSKSPVEVWPTFLSRYSEFLWDINK
jgi:hypothetical protein